jgi:hypothetical protein
MVKFTLAVVLPHAAIAFFIFAFQLHPFLVAADRFIFFAPVFFWMFVSWFAAMHFNVIPAIVFSTGSSLIGAHKTSQENKHKSKPISTDLFQLCISLVHPSWV